MRAESWAHADAVGTERLGDESGHLAMLRDGRVAPSAPPAQLFGLQRLAGNAAVVRGLPAAARDKAGASAPGRRAAQPTTTGRAAVQRVETPTQSGLSRKYHTTIGSAEGRGGAFSPTMLRLVERVLATLPTSHTRGNDMLEAILNESGDAGAASVYSYDPTAAPGERGVINLTTPPMPLPARLRDLLYPYLDSSWAWQRYLMDR